MWRLALLLSCCVVAQLTRAQGIAQVSLQHDTLATDILHFLEPAPEPHPKRLRLGLGTAGGLVAASYTYLGFAWYAQTDLGRFHWFDDMDQWQQMDKIGHTYGAYLQSRAIMEIMKWGGAKRKNVLLWGGMSGFLLQAPIEVFDGFAEKWGASWGDIAFNAAGAGLATLNEGVWREPRLHMKFSFWPSQYAADYPDQLGTGTTQVLKDYNGQKYWLSLRVNSFLPEGKFKRFYPDWLNLCVGYSGDGMIGGYGEDDPSVIAARESRQYYLGLDIDLEQIKTKKRGLRLLFGILNTIRLPLPALELNRNRVYFRPIVF